MDRTVLPPLTPAVADQVVDREGRLLRAWQVADGLWRLPTALDQVDPRFVELLLAYEDKRFRDHPGVDWRATLRALWQAARHGRVVSGASTLTMQTARLLEDGTTGALAGKIRQARVALALERRLTKPQILDLYLTLAPYGGNVEGLRAASLIYFGKEPRRLTPAEAALLIALPQSPEARRPDRNPAAARAARDRVLARLATTGVLATSDAEAALRDPVPDARRPFPLLAAHATEAARADGVAALTLDADLQARLEAFLRAATDRLAPRLSAALIVADHRTGEVLARIGSPDILDAGRGGFVDMTVAQRSPGSTLKPLIYGLAFERGLAHPETLIEDRPTAFGAWVPSNFDGAHRGTVTVRRALELSLNVPAVQTLEAVGPATLMARMRRAGLDPALPEGAVPGLAVALGGLGLSLEELVTLYAALARGGEAVPLRTHGPAAPGRRLLTPEAAWQVGDILAGIAPPRAAATGLAYKTGTSYGHRDTWALGFDGRYVLGVWVGRPDGTPAPGALGVDLAAPLLFEAFAHVTDRPEPLAPPPATVLTVATAELPLPLQRLRRPGLGHAPADPGPEIAFPPNGATLELAGGVPLRVRHGSPPFTWLIDGRPLPATIERDAIWPDPGPGFAQLRVLDAEGRAASAQIRLR